MEGPERVLVTKLSATHCRDWENGSENICAINRSHSDMVKFAPQDQDYENALERIGRLARRSLTARTAKEKGTLVAHFGLSING